MAFLYGIFHAAGPGHGKAVISSYMIANDETWRRGIILSFVSAMIQSIVAVLLVGIAAGIIGVTSRAMGETVRWIEIASYGLIAILGLQLTWTKGRGFLASFRGEDTHDHDHHHIMRTLNTAITTTPVVTARTSIMRTAPTHDHSHGHVHAASLSAGAVHAHHHLTTPDIHMARCRKSSPAPVAGAEDLKRSLPSACGRVRARSSFSCLRWRRACSGPVSWRRS